MRGANTPHLLPTRHHLTATNRNYVRRSSRQSQAMSENHQIALKASLR